jgi:eukaryotic-like serine/threonine-protein kinase
MEEKQPDNHETITVGRPAGGSDTRAPVAGGQAIGRYIVIEKLGEGGMGLVLRAYDPKLGREVALKILKPGSVSEERRARLVREAQAMAKLTHPNVVAVYDVEDSGEQVILAMEYVAGQTLGYWLREKKRKPTEIVGQFIEAGQGLAAAHAVGLMHRDFKPANVLVSKSGQVKVTDFGLARLNEAPTGSESQTGMGVPIGSESGRPGGAPQLLTQAGLVMGTPAYMAPEQHAGEALGPQTDQYAFSASLWQALTGGLPFTANTLETLRAMKSAGAPEWPKRAAGAPQRWIRAIRRGLAVTPEERWPNLQELLQELRYDPARTRRLQVAAGLCGIALAGAAGAWTVWRAQVTAGCKAEGARVTTVWNAGVSQQIATAFAETNISYATETWSHAAPQMDQYTRELQASRTEACLWGERDGRLSRELLERSRSCFEEHLAQLKSLVEQLQRPDGAVVQRATTVAYGLPLVKECRDEQELGRREFAAGNEALQTLTKRLGSAEGLLLVGRYEGALAIAAEVRDLAGTKGFLRMVAAARRLAGQLQYELGQFQEAKTSLEQAYREAEVLGDDLGALRAASLQTRVVGFSLSAHEFGLLWYSLAMMKAQRLKLGSEHPDVVMARSGLAAILFSQGKYPEAEVEYRQALTSTERAFGQDHPRNAFENSNLAFVLATQGKSDAEAEACARRAVALLETAYGPNHPGVALALASLAFVLQGQGRYHDAEAADRRAIAIFEKVFEPNHPDLAGLLDKLGEVLRNQERYKEAEALHRRALAIWEKVFGPDHLDTANSLFGIGISLEKQGNSGEALPMLERVNTIRDKMQSPPTDRAEVRCALGRLLWSRPGQRARARGYLKEAIELSPAGSKTRGEAERFLAELR